MPAAGEPMAVQPLQLLVELLGAATHQVALYGLAHDHLHLHSSSSSSSSKRAFTHPMVCCQRTGSQAKEATVLVYLP
jgi:hypothetical protein